MPLRFLALTALGIALTLGLACQSDLTDEQIDQIAAATVDSLMENPTYLEYLEDDQWVDAFTEAFLSNPKYQQYLDTTEREDCASIILMATVLSQDYSNLPRDHEVDTLCDWYKDQIN